MKTDVKVSFDEEKIIKPGKNIKHLKKDQLKWDIISNTTMGIAALIAVIPLILLVIASLTDNEYALANGFSFFPKKWSVDAYLYITGQVSTIGKSYLMTIIVTVIGTVLSIFLTSGVAFALSRDNLPGRKILNILCVIPMLFSGGIVASYYVWVNIFHIKNTIWGLILPGLLLNTFNIILVKNYFKNSIPEALLEAARMDGAGEMYVFFKIVLPLSIPIIATIGLMTGLAYWNDWTNGLYYLSARGGSQYCTIQLVLNQINSNLQFLAGNSSGVVKATAANMPTATVRMAIAVIGILPILVAYPFFQKYFVKGITLGGVKE